jgi:hypothetical protein
MKTQKATMTSQSRNKHNMNESYIASAKGAQKRIRTPHPHDVLSGRGGGINSHAGNKTFREWIRVRKEDYNLAGSKAEKAKVASEVMDLVRNQNPPGRFLQRENNSVAGPSWWVEIDEARALAKTSQALREGAPQIRAAHKDELHDRIKVERGRKTKRKKTTATTETVKASTPNKRPKTSQRKLPVLQASLPGNSLDQTFQPPAPINTQIRATVSRARSVSTDKALETLQRNVEAAKSQAERQTNPLAPPLMSNRAFNDKYQNRHGFQIDTSAETPPLTPIPSESLPPIPPLTPFGRSKSIAGRGNGLPRMHSLALSDVSTGDFGVGDEEFVNPFADESDIYSKIDSTSPSRQTRLLRNISSDETQEKADNTSHNKNSFLGGRQRSSLGSRSSRYVFHMHCPKPRSVLSSTENCFCDCALPVSNGGDSCICADLADHVLHRGDGLSMFLDAMM